MILKKRNGFTVVELIVVIVILAILAALLVPALLGWIDKAKDKNYILEARNVVMASQAAATEEYASGRFNGSGADFITYCEADILAMADVTGTIDAVEFQKPDGTPVAVIGTLTYKTADGITVLYDVNGSPVYQINKKGSNSTQPGAPTYQKEWEELFANMGSSNYTSGELRAVLENTFPDLKEHEKEKLSAHYDNIKSITNTDNFHWLPCEVQSAGNLGDGHGYVMVATTKESGIRGNMIYYNGNYYVHVQHHSYQGFILTEGNVPKEFDITLLDPARSMSDFSPDDLQPGQSSWYKV